MMKVEDLEVGKTADDSLMKVDEVMTDDLSI